MGQFLKESKKFNVRSKFKAGKTCDDLEEWDGRSGRGSKREEICVYMRLISHY